MTNIYDMPKDEFNLFYRKVCQEKAARDATEFDGMLEKINNLISQLMLEGVFHNVDGEPITNLRICATTTYQSDEKTVFYVAYEDEHGAIIEV